MTAARIRQSPSELLVAQKASVSPYQLSVEVLCSPVSTRLRQSSIEVLYQNLSSIQLRQSLAEVLLRIPGDLNLRQNVAELLLFLGRKRLHQFASEILLQSRGQLGLRQLGLESLYRPSLDNIQAYQSAAELLAQLPPPPNSCQVLIEWEPVERAFGYIVRVFDNSGYNPPPVAEFAVPPSQTSVPFNAIIGRDYWYEVVATGDGRVFCLKGLPARASFRVESPAGTAVEFSFADGRRGFVAGSPVFNPPQFTYEFWFKSAGFGELVRPISNIEAPANGFQFTFEKNIEGNGIMSFQFWDGFSIRFVSTFPNGPPLSEGVWHHIAATRDENYFRMWLDGEKVDEGIAGYEQVISNADLHFTRIGDTGSPFILDEVRISNIARYSSNFTPATSHPVDANTVAYWKFNEGSGSTVADSSGNGHTMTLTGVPVWVEGV